MRAWALLLSIPIVLRAGPVRCEDAPEGARTRQPNAVYVELLGKHGLYGIGYDRAATDWFAFGAAGAFFVVESERVLSFGPYVSFYPLAGRSSALLLQVGGQFVQVSVPSRVPAWSGVTAAGVSGQVSAGYEYRAGFLFRALLSAVAGEGGVRPWVGVAMGVAF